jgi:hypothetical protein
MTFGYMAQFVMGKNFDTGDVDTKLSILGNVLFAHEWMAARHHVIDFVMTKERESNEDGGDIYEDIPRNITLLELASRPIYAEWYDSDDVESWPGVEFFDSIQSIVHKNVDPIDNVGPQWIHLFDDILEEQYKRRTVEKVVLGSGGGPYTIVTTVESGDGHLDFHNHFVTAFRTDTAFAILHVVIYTVAQAVYSAIRQSFREPPRHSQIHYRVGEEFLVAPGPNSPFDSVVTGNLRMLLAISHSRDTGPLGKMAGIVRQCTYSPFGIDDTVRKLIETLTEIEYSLDVATADMCSVSFHVQVHPGLVLVL